MRAICGCGLVVVLLAAVAAHATGDKIDPAKLVGKWAPVKAKVKATTEFTGDGKVITTIEIKGKDVKNQGTYKVDGDKLTIKSKVRGKEEETESTITKLTDDELVFVTPKYKKTDTLKKVR
jgi:uncharacterized protein (TIGR03066 family)